MIATKSTRLGLDLKGGTELVYQGQPTPQVPKVTPQALDDALETIRKRTDALGVSEPEIQRSGRDQISIGLPDVQNAQRAIDQVGSTAQLQFYDWEPNVLGDRGPDVPYAGSKALYDAVEVASKQKPKAEKDDVPPGSDVTPQEADKQNDSTATSTTCSARTATRSARTSSRCARASTSRRRTARTCCPTSRRRAAPRTSTPRTRSARPSSRRSARAARRTARA